MCLYRRDDEEWLQQAVGGNDVVDNLQFSLAQHHLMSERGRLRFALLYENNLLRYRRLL